MYQGYFRGWGSLSHRVHTAPSEDSQNLFLEYEVELYQPAVAVSFAALDDDSYAYWQTARFFLSLRPYLQGPVLVTNTAEGALE